MTLPNKIFCFGDGYAHGHIWPEWPQILQALCIDHNVVIESGIGAGHEFLVHQLLTHQDIATQRVVFQWPNALRFDKFIQDNKWLEIATADPVYGSNLYNNNTWWLSSASMEPDVRKYHRFYVQPQQSRMRLQDQKVLVNGYLNNLGCVYYETSTDHQEQFSSTARFADKRGKQVQPSPIVHLEFVVEYVAPGINLELSQDRVAQLRSMIANQNWMPYDPDASKIWQHMISCIE